MPLEFFEITEVIPGSPEEIYSAWLDSQKHAAMTRSPATIEGFVNGTFAIADGYIRGKTLELEPNRRIIQSWRSTEFPEDAGDSRVDVRLEPSESGTRVTIAHFDIPEGQSERYREGWHKFYFLPMKQFFGGSEDFDQETTPTSEVMPAETSADDSVTMPDKPARQVKTSRKPARKAAARRAKASSKPARKAAARRAKPGRKARSTRVPKRRVGRPSAAKRSTAKRGSASKRTKKKSPTRAGKRGAKRRSKR